MANKRIYELDADTTPDSDAELVLDKSTYAAPMKTTVGQLLQNLTLGGPAITRSDGVADAVQKIVTVDDATVFVPGCHVEYGLVSGILERNTVNTVDSGTQITLTTNIGTGGIADNSPVAVIPIGFYNAGVGVYNVRDYGAAGDGVTEDASAIQATINAVAATGGGGVYLPAGTYLVNTELQVKDDVSLIGQGIDVSIITTGATLANGVINIWQSGSGAGSGADNVTLRDFTLSANGAARIAASLGGYVRGIRSMFGPENLLIQRVKIDGGGERAIEINQPIRCRITDCVVLNTSTVAGNLGDAIHCEGTNGAIQKARNIVIDGNIVETWGDCAIATTACDQVVIANNVCTGEDFFGRTPAAVENGIDMTGVTNGVCTGNKITRVLHGFITAIENNAGEVYPAQNITIANNVCSGSTSVPASGYGIVIGSSTAAVTTCRNITVTGNTLDTTYYAGISVYSPVSDVTIVGNTIRNAMLEGAGDTPSDAAILIGVDSALNATRVLCAGNTIYDSGTNIDSGIYVNAANTENVIYGNNVFGSSVTQDVYYANAAANQGETHSTALVLDGGLVVNENGYDLDTRIEGDTDVYLVNVDAGSDRVGVGVGVPLGKLHIDQSSGTGAIPTLFLDQGDDDQAMIALTATVGTGNAIEAVGAKTLTTTHFIKATITGVGTVYIPCGTIT